MKHLIKLKDGKVAIMTTTADDIDPNAEFLKWGEEKAANVDSHRTLVEGELPQTKVFQKAWRHQDDKVVIDMPIALGIHQDNLRKLRAPKLLALDVEYQRADEQGDQQKKKEIADAKQALRDVTRHESVLNAKTPEELEAAVPDVLK